MTTAELVTFSSLLGALAFFWALSSAILWARIVSVEDRAEPKQLAEVKTKAEAVEARLDAQILQLGKFREGVHGEMQRFYSIMRRNEKALAGPEPEGEDGEEHPDEVSLDALKKPAETEIQSRAELRRIARERGHRI